jgi:hypothetical protein
MKKKAFGGACFLVVFFGLLVSNCLGWVVQPSTIEP